MIIKLRNKKLLKNIFFSILLSFIIIFLLNTFNNAFLLGLSSNEIFWISTFIVFTIRFLKENKENKEKTFF